MRLQGAFASRMSHSCTPNCQAVVMSCGGRLTIAVYTLRQVHPGEELTFDYASVTESEKEFRTAICLCGTRHCRGTFLMFAGSRAFQQASAFGSKLQGSRASCKLMLNPPCSKGQLRSCPAMAGSHSSFGSAGAQSEA